MFYSGITFYIVYYYNSLKLGHSSFMAPHSSANHSVLYGHLHLGWTVPFLNLDVLTEGNARYKCKKCKTKDRIMEFARQFFLVVFFFILQDQEF